ncbi:MAG: autotransporter outer membrane beta-barrel domain-containing protein [Akkermansia sp.]|nr:autotransporter outer membrane beta-barrel domain-containing protein [Akkermansia sp.]
MKLHIPRLLRAALLAAISAASAGADIIPYSGTIYSWEGANNSFHQGSLYVTTQNPDGSFTPQAEASGNWSRDFCAVSTAGGNDTTLATANTLRYASGAVFPSISFTFTPLTVAGFIIESDTVVNRMSGGNRVIRFGNSSDVAAYSTINSDFTLSGGTSVTYLRGTQQWEIDAGKTFTLASPTQIERNLTLAGDGTVSFTNVLSINSGASATLSDTGTLQIANAIVNNGTLNLAGSVDLQGFANIPAATAPSAGINGFATRAGFSVTVVSGNGAVTGADSVTWKVQGDEAEASAATFADGELQVQAGSTTIYYVQAENSLVERSDSSLPTASGFVVTSSGNTLTLKSVDNRDMYNGVSFSSAGSNTLVIDSGSELSGAVLSRAGGTLNATVKGTFTISDTAVRVNGSMSVGADGELLLQVGDALGYRGGGDYTDSITMQGTADAPALMSVSMRQTMSTPLVLNGYSTVSNAADAVTAGAQIAGLEAYGYSITATGKENVIGTRLLGRGGSNVEINVSGSEDELLISGAFLVRDGQTDSPYIKTGEGTLQLSSAENVFSRLYEHRNGTTLISGQTVMQQGFSLENGTLRVAENGQLTSSVGVSTVGNLEVNGLLTLAGGASDLAQLSGSGLLDASGNEVSIQNSAEIGAVLADSVTMTGADGNRNLTLTSADMNSVIGTLSGVETLTLGPSAALNVTDSLTVKQIELKVASITPLLTVGTLNPASGRQVGINAVAEDAVLLGMGNGDTLTLATVNANNADLVLSVNGTDSYDLTNSSGYTFTYALVENGTRGVDVVLTASRKALGWIGETGDVWSDNSAAEWVGTPPSATSPARFFGDGIGAVQVDSAGVRAQQVLVSADAPTDAYTFRGGAVRTAVLAVSEGSLTIDNAVEVRQDTGFAGDSGLVVVGDSGSLSISVGGSLLAEAELQVQGKGKLTNAGALTAAVLHAPKAVVINSGTLTVASGDISGLTGGKLEIEDVASATAGTLTLQSDVALEALSGTGVLDAGEHAVTLSSASGTVGVKASELTLLSGGASLGEVQVKQLVLGGNIALSTSQAPLSVSSMAAGTLLLTEDVFSTIPTVAGGVYVPGDYMLLQGAGTGVVFDEQSRLQAIRRVGLTAGAVSENQTLLLRIQDSPAPMTWNTQDDNRVTSNGYIVPTGAGLYKALDYAERIEIPDTLSLNLSDTAVGDAVIGNATDPAAGLFLRNVQGGGQLSLVGNGAERDAATLISTAEMTTPVRISADGLRLNAGLPEGSTGILPGDSSRAPIVLRELRLQNGAQFSVTPGQSVEIGTLLGTAGTRLQGDMTLSGTGSIYRGDYQNAQLVALPGSTQLLVPGQGLSLRTQQTDTTLDVERADAVMEQLISDKSRMTLLNTASNSDGGIQHHSLTFNKASSVAQSELTLSLGVAESAASLGRSTIPVVLSGPITLSDSVVYVNMLQNADRQANYLPVNTDSTEDLVLAQLVEGGSVTGSNRVVLQGDALVQALLKKYYTNARLAPDGSIRVDRVTRYYSRYFPGGNSLEQQGLSMVDKTLLYLNPQASPEKYPDLSALLDVLDNAVTYDNSGAARSLAAAVSGSSAAALSAAVAGDMERQLRTLRNRVSTMGMAPDPCKGSIPELPAFHAWVNAEGDHTRLHRSGDSPGYELSTWGGTAGLAVDTSPCLTLGLAFSYMHGDFEAKSVEAAEGNLDFYYINAFARYSTIHWLHSFVASLGMADAELSRHQPLFSTEGSTDGMSFGFLYELAYQIPINEQQDIMLQPLVNVAFSHSALDGYSETGSDAGLRFGDSDVTAVTFGLGGRFVGSAGENLYNRKSRVEGRALLKLRAGDRDAAISSSLLAVPTAGAHVRSAEQGVVGVELGAGISVPIGSESGSLFFDASFEIYSDYSEVNGVIGYQIDF